MTRGRWLVAGAALSLAPVGCQLAFPISEGAGSSDAALVDGHAPTPDGRMGTPDTSTPVSDACTASANPAVGSLVDTFASATIASQWVVTTPGCVSDVAGAIVATPAANNAGDYCILKNAFNTSYHLTCSQIVLKVPTVTSPVLGVQTFLDISPSGSSSQSLDVILEAGGFSFALAATMDLGGYNATNDLWWRLREVGGQVEFSTSPDASSWNVRGATPAPFSLDALEISFGAGAYKSVASPGQARFQCFNVPGGC